MQHRTTILAVALALLAGSSFTPVLAHEGDGGGIDGLRLEAETYRTPDSACDPDFDNEHTLVESRAGASGGKNVFLPHSGCGLNFGEVEFPGWVRASEVRFMSGGANTNFRVEVTVRAGDVESRATRVASPSDGLVVAAFEDALPIGPGASDVRVSYRVLSGPSFGNLFLDYVDFVTVQPPALPGPPRDLRADPGSQGGQIRLNWMPPADDGGLPVKRYEVYRGASEDDMQHLASVTGTSFLDMVDVTRVWHYEVAAVNAVGEGPASAPACSPANPWSHDMPPPTSAPCPLPPGWEEATLLDTTQPVPAGPSTPAVPVDAASVRGAPLPEDPRFYRVSGTVAGVPIPAVTLFTAGLLDAPIEMELDEVPAQDTTPGLVVTVRASLRWDPAQTVCLLGVDDTCLALAPLDPTRPDDAGRGALVVHIRVASEDGGALLHRTVTVPFAGQAAGPLL